jgi:hypothetical protein
MQGMNIAIDLPRDEIAAYCQRHHIRRLALFGSVLREDFSSDSDVDVLVEFDPAYPPRLDDLLAAEAELSTLLGRRVDLGEKRAVEQDPNYRRRRCILDSAAVIYEG